jgi:hypothetical protein
LTRFFVALAAVSSLLVLAGWVSVRLEWIQILPSFFFQTLFLLLFGTCLIYIYLYRLNKAAFFVQVYLLTMAVKLLAYGVYNFFVITEDLAGAVSNVIWFMLLYFIFTVLEIGFLYQKISK